MARGQTPPLPNQVHLPDAPTVGVDVHCGKIDQLRHEDANSDDQLEPAWHMGFVAHHHS